MRKILLLAILLVPAFAFAAEMCPQISSTMRRGMSGEEVRQLQVFLIQQDLLAQDLATGYFGSYTEAAVQKFQCTHMEICSGSASENGYGQVGPATRAKIAGVCIGDTATAPTQIPDSAPTLTTFLPDNTLITPENSCPYYFPPDCAGGTLVQSGTDANGCSLGYRCVVTSTTTPEVCASIGCQGLGSDPVALSCTVSNVTIRDGQSYTYYSMPFSTNCYGVSQTRFCARGILSGDSVYIYPMCVE